MMLWLTIWLIFLGSQIDVVALAASNFKFTCMAGSINKFNSIYEVIMFVMYIFD